MARGGNVDVADVKAMLRMADREWSNNGLIASNKKNESQSYRLIASLDAYRGYFPDSLGGAADHVDQFVGNLFFSIFNTLMAQTSARDPDPVIRPLGGTAADEDAWRRAWLNQKLMSAVIREKKFRREADRALQSAVLSPFGLVRHGYTPDIEEYEKDGIIHHRVRSQTPDLPWIQALMPWQVRIDPMVNHFDMDGEPGWIAFQNLYRTRMEIRDNPALIDRQDWRPTFNYDMRPLHERVKPRVAHSGVPGRTGKKEKEESISMYEEWVVYDARRRTFYGVSHGSDSLVREERDWPLNWGQLPASILTFNEQMDSPFGIPFPQMIWNEQMLYNKIWTIINALVSRFRRVVIVNGAAFSGRDVDMENLTNPESLAEFIVANGDVSQAIKEIGLHQLDGQIIGLLFQLKEQIREVLGISSFDRGQRANVETAAEANQIGAGGALAKSRVQSKFEAFWTDIIRVSHRAILDTEDTRSIFVPVIGEENLSFLTEGEVAQGFVEAKLDELKGEFDYGVKLNSTTPLDPAAEFTKLGQVYTMIGGPKAELANHVMIQKRLFSLAGEDPEKAIVSQQVAEQMGTENPEGSGATAGAPPQASDVASLQQVIGGAQ